MLSGSNASGGGRVIEGCVCPPPPRSAEARAASCLDTRSNPCMDGGVLHGGLLLGSGLGCAANYGGV